MSDYFADDILVNKLGIVDVAELKEAEQRITAEKTAQLLDENIPDKFDMKFFKHIHRILFEDLYDFAGLFRTVDIVKPGSRIPFAYAKFLESESRRIFDELGSKDYLTGYDFETFIVEISNLAAELNALHPFREGNGRAIRLYLILLADHAGYVLDLSRASTDELISADIRAFEGDEESLHKLYRKITLSS